MSIYDVVVLLISIFSNEEINVKLDTKYFLWQNYTELFSKENRAWKDSAFKKLKPEYKICQQSLKFQRTLENFFIIL